MYVRGLKDQPLPSTLLTPTLFRESQVCVCVCVHVCACAFKPTYSPPHCTHNIHTQTDLKAPTGRVTLYIVSPLHAGNTQVLLQYCTQWGNWDWTFKATAHIEDLN